MDADLKKRWVEELRSDRRTQGHGRLCLPDGSQCCLGVLSDLITQPIKGCVWDGRKWKCNYSCDYLMNLPHAVAEHVGFEEGITAKLANMNDRGLDHNGIPMTFGEIADWIEENL